MKKLTLIVSLILILAFVTVASAQVSYEDSAYSSYQIVNLGEDVADITVTYYDETGTPAAFQQSFLDVPVNGAVTVQQALEGDLAAGRYSAVIASDWPVAAIANQQLGVEGSGNSIAPFSSYTGASEGSTEVILPAVMYNWYGYYTDLYIQNVEDSAAANIQIEYIPTTLGTCTTGKAYTQDVLAADLAAYTTIPVSQFDLAEIGADAADGCSGYTGRFLGMAKVTSDKKIVVIANEVVNNKLFTYNGFTAAGTTVIAPAYMRNFYNYYASLTIANTTGVDANITVTYTPGAGSVCNDGAACTVVANHVIPANKSITIYDGPTASPDQTDLEGVYNEATEKFFGTVKIESDQDVVALVNQESTSAAGNQSGSYNAMLTSEGTGKISVPLIQSDFYGYYTSLTIMTVDGGEATVTITYTSDSTFSSVVDHSETYTLSTTDGFLNRYEGSSASAAQSDILDDVAWVGAGGKHLFLGSATIEVTSGSDIVAFVNSESSKAPHAAERDSMYTYNAFNLAGPVK